MASLDYWAEAPMLRRQRALFAPTLDAMISPDDPVRLVDELLAGIDWSAWEAEYDGKRGQPPIHPRIIAAAMLYGLCRGIRSTRKLQEACCYRLDFLWLVEGHQIDHTTFAKFRTRFGPQLKEVFRQLGRLAMNLGLVRLGEVAFDGTRVKSQNSRYNTKTAKTLAEKLAALDAQFDQMLAESDATEQQQRLDDSPTQLPDSIADLKQRREKVQAALDKAHALDELRRKDGVNPEKNPAQVPMNDPESRVMPNKEGGYAPNYTPTATTDGHAGYVLECEVLGEVNETPQAVPSVDRIAEDFGRYPEQFCTDTGNISGLVQQAMEERGIEFYAPVESQEPQPATLCSAAIWRRRCRKASGRSCRAIRTVSSISRASCTSRRRIVITVHKGKCWSSRRTRETVAAAIAARRAPTVHCVRCACRLRVKAAAQSTATSSRTSANEPQPE